MNLKKIIKLAMLGIEEQIASLRTYDNTVLDYAKLDAKRSTFNLVLEQIAAIEKNSRAFKKRIDREVKCKEFIGRTDLLKFMNSHKLTIVQICKTTHVFGLVDMYELFYFE